MKKDNVNFMRKSVLAPTAIDDDDEDIESVNFSVDSTSTRKQMSSPSSSSGGGGGMFGGLSSYFAKSRPASAGSGAKPAAAAANPLHAKVNSAFGANSSSALTDSDDSSPVEPGCINRGCVVESLFHIFNIIVLLLTIGTNFWLVQVIIEENIESPANIDYRDVGLRFYAILLSALMLTVEINLRCITKKMKIFDRYIARGLMYVLIALITYSDLEQRVVVISLVQTLFGVLYIVSHCLRRKEIYRHSLYRTVEIDPRK